MAKQKTSFTLSPEALALLETIKDKTGLSKASVLEMLIREKAAKMGVKPVRQVDSLSSLSLLRLADTGVAALEADRWHDPADIAEAKAQIAILRTYVKAHCKKGDARQDEVRTPWLRQYERWLLEKYSPAEARKSMWYLRNLLAFGADDGVVNAVEAYLSATNSATTL